MADKLTVVSSQLRGATLGAQLLGSLVALSALSDRDALTGPAQITGLVVYVSVFVGAIFMCSVRWLGVTTNPYFAPVSSSVHFFCAALVNIALFGALTLVTGNTEDNNDKGRSDPAVNRIEVAAVAGAAAWGIHLAHTSISFLLWRVDDTITVNLGGIYERLLNLDALDEEEAEPVKM